jgi:hypothetical protein
MVAKVGINERSSSHPYQRRYTMKDVLSDNYQDVEELIRKLKGRMHDIEKDIMENGGDGPDWMYLDGYNQCVNDLEKLMEEDNE